MMIMRQLHRLARCFEVSAEVQRALETNRPLVALESTIITHGMPHPHNVETALQVEDIVRSQNAVPATIAVVNGKVKVGLTTQEIQTLAASKDQHVVKTSRRDLAFVLSKGLSGGTTVSGTMVVAKSVGIKVFVTGGIGGVHRGGEDSMDVSADLTELGRTRLAVVCGGVKSILDVGRTLEYLETQGVCVATYSHSKDFPAFYCRKSGHLAPYNVTTPEEAAALLQSLEDLQLQSGVVFAVPVPEKDQLISDEKMESAIGHALKLAAEKNIVGKSITPFLLQRVAELTQGRSLQTNIALIKNNADVGAKISVALSKISQGNQKSRNKSQIHQPNSPKHYAFSTPKAEEISPIVVGGSIMDSVVSVSEPFKVEARTMVGRIRQSGGGVGRNIADALGKLGVRPRFISAVGDDQYGKFLLEQTLGHVDCKGVVVSPDLPTASYTAMIDQVGEFRMGVGDMDIHSLITVDSISRHFEEGRSVPAVIVDGNIPLASINFIMEHCYKHHIPVIFEPTDVNKAIIPFQSELWKTLRLITPNMKELRRIASFIGLGVDAGGDSTDTSLEEVVSMASPLAQHIQTVMVTLGPLGVMMVGSSAPGAPVTARHYPATHVDKVLSVSGAGDCLAAGVLSGILAGLEETLCVSVGLAAAQDSLGCYSAVPQQFSVLPSSPDLSPASTVSSAHGTLRRSLP